MHFTARHRFHGTADAVCAVLCDPEFYVKLELPDLAYPELLTSTSAGDDIVLRLRYEYVGDIDPLAHRLLGHQRLSWIQEVRVDRREGSGTLVFEAERNPKLLHGKAGFVLSPDGDGTVRQLDGDLVVAMLGVGGMAEHLIVPGLLRRLDIEARALDDQLPPTS